MKAKLTIGPEGLQLGSRPFYLAGGDMHYFRVMPSGWPDRLRLMKDFGLTAVQTYVPWNAHEPVKGQFDFQGLLHLAAFLEAAHECELKVMLRPSPYICSEWDMGGLPAWLLQDPNLDLRCSNPIFLRHVASYYQRLCKEFVPYLSTHGGPIVAVAVENEYGSYGNDQQYLTFLRDELEKNHVDVPFYTTDGHSRQMLHNGTLKGVWAGVNYRLESDQAITALQTFQPDLPPLVGEFWSGRSMHWGEEYSRRQIEPVAEAYQQALQRGANVCFYMFCGGTNFGFMNGANFGQPYAPRPGEQDKYLPGPTSYEVDALVSEGGQPTPKYFACRQVLDHFLGRPARPDHRPPSRPSQAIKEVRLSTTATLFENLSALAAATVACPNLKTMEELGQSHGFILYSTVVTGPDTGPHQLHLDGLHDRATVYADGRYLGSRMRDRQSAPILISIPPAGLKLDILVENLGRINFGPKLWDRKGILHGVRLDNLFLFNWTIRTLPMTDLTGLAYHPPKKIVPDTPGFYRGIFKATPGIDTFLLPSQWHKGVVWINHFNLGRYWHIGPQKTLYVPGELLQAENTIEMFEIHNPAPDHSVEFAANHILS